MSAIVDTREILKPIYQAKPDMRFATTFMSTKFRDYAVRGESIMDKVTGEIFTKRKEDGRVVSFFQNKKYLHNLMLELRILLNNNPNFRYPKENSREAYYVSTDYDVMSINDEKDIDIVTNNITIPNSEDAPYHQLDFKISTKSNGYFCRLTTRDSDKAIIEWITNQYNLVLKNYEGNNSDFRTESKKFVHEKWEDSNATVNYTFTITLNDGSVSSYTLNEYVRINEESCIYFPSTLSSSILNNANSVKIRINNITFDKLHFMLEHKNDLPEEFMDGYNRFIYPDNAIYIRYINICSFVDKSSDIELLGNEFIVALMDVPYTYRYMMKMSTLMSESSVILSSERPGSDLWKPNGLWAEEIRQVFQGGEIVDLDTESEFNDIEDFFSENNRNLLYTKIVLDPTDTDNIYGKQV